MFSERSARLSWKVWKSFSIFLSFFVSLNITNLSFVGCSSGNKGNVVVESALDLHTTAVHLDDLGSEGLDGSQDELLVLQGSDAQTHHISVDTGEQLSELWWTV